MTVGPSAPGTVAVVICAYTEKRWDDVLDAYHSVLGQSVVPDEVILVVDHNPALLARLTLACPRALVIANTAGNGLSGARNTGIEAADSDIVLFLDDDARAADGWVEQMVAPFTDPQVQGVAGWADPNWDGAGQPRWFPEPFLWVVGCSYEGMPTTQVPVRNPLGCSMAFRRPALAELGGFTSGIGRVGTHPVGCEETEFSIRLRQRDPAARILSAPGAVVHHRVTENRRTLGYFSRRCYWEGVSKALVAKGVGRNDALATERSYVSTVLPRAVFRGVKDALRGDVHGLLRGAAVVYGLGATSLGYVRGLRAAAQTELVEATPLVRSEAA
ncbi:glycosyltransferase family 2 protein [Nakamurella flavida]|uniref:Glycosyltransferase family 2 protein n=1 Tax=Nakamurella flavida TaxID=363630 RepID=A0A938YJF4_9ACTN|nr:glycosyltransferase family 2 protein [Nakamurella flavida]MBM9475706.1 glycosyltransferase family 2 protein [Nakamurella flavida]MDP9778016.1 GT2 family glycosyltransferase [Nakamurella flavida]